MVNLSTSVFLFVGGERYLKENALHELKTSLAGDSPAELDYKVFYGDESSARDILDHLSTLPLFSTKRLVVVRDPERLPREDRSRIAEYIKKPSRSDYIVLDSDSDSAINEFNVRSQHVKVMRFESLPDRDMSLWIKKFVASKGKKMDEDAMLLLKEIQGPSLLSISGELEKLITFTGKRKDITIRDVEGLVGKSVMASAFDLGWMIGEKDVAGAIKLVSDLMLFGKRPYEVIGLLSWHLNRMLKAKALIVKGESPGSVIGALRIHSKDRDRFLKQIKAFSYSQLKAKLGTLLEADLDIKRSRLNPVLVLEVAIIRLCLAG
ncbi:MAG: DNA polymerase III subunit delta [Candidatus Omnitrophota bacterium]|jgi:DNA polymerase-3 subunit delta